MSECCKYYDPGPWNIFKNDGESRVFMEDNNYNWAINLVRYGNPITVMAELNQLDLEQSYIKLLKTIYRWNSSILTAA